MATANCQVEIRVSGKEAGSTTKTNSVGFHRKEKKLWGGSWNYYVYVYPPGPGYVPIGNHGASYVIHRRNENVWVRFTGISGSQYNFKLHIGTRRWKEGELQATMYGKYRKAWIAGRYTSFRRTLTIDKMDKDYRLLLNCTDLIPKNWYDLKWGVVRISGERNIVFKLTNSSTNPSSTAQGSFLWARYSDVQAPRIFNIKPADNTVFINPRLEISADLTDYSGSGVDLSTFSLTIDEGTEHRLEANAQTKEKDGLIKISESGFLYRPTIDLSSDTHNIKITCADKHGNVSTVLSSFIIDFKAFNPTIGAMPVESLEHLGLVNKAKYNKVGIISIGDLVNQNPRELSTTTGIRLATVIDNVKRAQITCAEIRFYRGLFGELYGYSIAKINSMSDEELLKLDITEESPEELKRLRDNIAMLYVCFDDKVLNKLTFGDIVWDQPE